MLSHTLEDHLGRLLPHWTLALGGNRQWVDQSLGDGGRGERGIMRKREGGGMVSGTNLGVLFAHVSEQVMDELVDESPWGVDASDELRDHLEPGVDVNGANTLYQSLMDIGEMAIVEPQSQQPGEDAYSVYGDMPAGSTCIETSLWNRSFQLSINTACVCVYVCMLYLRVSCNELSTESAMDRKNPWTAEQAYVTGDTSGGVGVSR